MEPRKGILYLGVTWTILFASLSFYWGLGGMFGVKSLGGSIYELALNPTPSFMVIVWMTGFIKLLGIVLLMMLLVKWRNYRFQKMLFFLTRLCGLLLFLYGLLNFITISLHAMDILDFDLDKHATFWRLVFWEPLWMAGGILYFYSINREIVPYRKN